MTAAGSDLAPTWGARWRSGWRLALRLAVAGMRSTPRRSAFTVCVLALGIGLMAVDLDQETGESALLLVGLVAVSVTALAAGRVPDAVRLRTSAMLTLAGAPRAVRRRIAMVDIGLSAAAAVVPGVVLGGLISRVVGNGDVHRSAVVYGMVIPVLLAMVVGGRGDDTEFRPRPEAGRARPPRAVRLLGGGVLVVGGVLIPGTARSWFDLDLTLVPGLLLVAIGLSMIAPLLLAAAGRMLSRVPHRPSVRLAGSLAVDRRRALGPAVCLIAAGSAAVVAQAVLGTGLADREAERRAAFDLRAGTGSDQVIVEARGLSWVRFFSGYSSAELGALGGPDGPPRLGNLAPEDVAAVERVAPEGEVAPIVVPMPSPDGGSIVVVADGVGSAGNEVVALATPELLRALGLERFEADVAAGRALVLDPKVSLRGGSVALRGFGSTSSADPDAGLTLVPARVVSDIGSTTTRLPAVIVPEPVFAAEFELGPDRAVTGLVVRLPRAASTSEVESIASATPALRQATVLRGDAIDWERIADGRLDAAGTVMVRTSGGAVAGVALVGAAGLVALAVGLRFAMLAHRAEDDLFEVVGAPPSTLGRMAAWQGALVTVVGVVLGLPVGLLGTASGIARYNAFGRDGLPPIPFGVPLPLVVGLVLLPVAGALVAWVSAGRRPPLDPVLLAERVTW